MSTGGCAPGGCGGTGQVDPADRGTTGSQGTEGSLWVPESHSWQLTLLCDGTPTFYLLWQPRTLSSGTHVTLPATFLHPRPHTLAVRHERDLRLMTLAHGVFPRQTLARLHLQCLPTHNSLAWHYRSHNRCLATDYVFDIVSYDLLRLSHALACLVVLKHVHSHISI